MPMHMHTRRAINATSRYRHPARCLWSSTRRLVTAWPCHSPGTIVVVVVLSSSRPLVHLIPPKLSRCGVTTRTRDALTHRADAPPSKLRGPKGIKGAFDLTRLKYMFRPRTRVTSNKRGRRNDDRGRWPRSARARVYVSARDVVHDVPSCCAIEQRANTCRGSHACPHLTDGWILDTWARSTAIANLRDDAPSNLVAVGAVVR